MKGSFIYFALLGIGCLQGPLAAKDKKIPELEKVTTIFVVGNSQSADKAREILRERKTCFSLAPKREDADAVLEIQETSTSDPGTLGTFGRRHAVVSATLTLSGAKSAASSLMQDRLAKAGNCKARSKKQKMP